MGERVAPPLIRNARSPNWVGVAAGINSLSGCRLFDFALASPIASAARDSGMYRY